MTKPAIKRAPGIPHIVGSDKLDPVYANMVRISHMPAEIEFDFALKLPGGTQAKMVSQVLMSPLSAKLFQRALAENLGKYEKLFGEIKIPGEETLQEYSKLFRPPEQESDD
jgi:hypothetical protein